MASASTRAGGALSWYRVMGAVAVIAPLGALGVLLGVVPAAQWRPANASETWAAVAAVAGVLSLSATVAVGLVAWYGLRSLRLSRQDMVTRATREARTLALARAEEFSAMLAGRHRQIGDALAKAGVQPFTDAMVSGTVLFEGHAIYPQAKAWWSKVPPATQNEIVYFLNNLEAWAMYFTQELAATDVVFTPIAPTYCSLIMQYAPWLSIARKEHYEHFYPNIVMLFTAWRAELDARERGSTVEAALRATKAANERLKAARVPDPLGTRVDF